MKVTLKAYAMPLNRTNVNYAILSVRYVVSLDPTFLDNTKKIKDVTKPIADNLMMEYTFDYDFPNKENLYGYIEYTYAGDKKDRSTTCRLTYLQPGFSFNNNIIATPELFIVGHPKHNLIPIEDLTIQATEMRMFQGHGMHEYSNWKLLDSNNKILLERNRDTFNVDSLVIPAALLEENQSYRIELVYNNNYDSESYPGVLIFSTVGLYNLLSVDESTISVNNNGLSSFNCNCNISGFQYLSVDVYNSASEAILEDFRSTSKRVILPKLGFDAGERYHFTISANYINHEGDTTNSKSVLFSAICQEVGEGNDYEPSYVYNNKLSIISADYKDTFIRNISGYVTQLENGDIPLFKIVDEHNINVRFYKWLGNSLVNTNREFTIATDSSVNLSTAVNIKLMTDLITGQDRLIVAYNIAGNKVEIKSYLFNQGEYGNVDPVVSPNTLILDNVSVLINSNPIIDFKDNEFLLGLININDNKTVVAIKKNLDSFSYVNSLYQASSIIGNRTSMFKLPDNKILKVNSDSNPQTYGIYDIATNSYVNKGVCPGIMQNLAGVINSNMWFGFDRLDGRVLLIPRVLNNDNFNIMLYDTYQDLFSIVINKEDILLPGKYVDGSASTLTNMLTIRLNDSNTMFIVSGIKNAVSFKDIWKYI